MMAIPNARERLEAYMEMGHQFDHAHLGSWKEIAQFLGKGVRTAQRWEAYFGLPVRRPANADGKTPIVAYPSELNEWITSRWSKRNKMNGGVVSLTSLKAEIRENIERARALRT